MLFFAISLLVYLTIFSLGFLSAKLQFKVSTILLGYLVGCGLYFSIRFGLLDGTSILNKSYLSFIGVLAISVACTIFFEREFRKVIWVALIAATLIITIQFVKNKGAMTLDHSNRNRITNVSKNKKNIFFISFDDLYNGDVREILAKNPGLKKDFAGFTNFVNTTSVGPFTDMSLATTVLGRVPDTNKSFDDAFYNNFQQNIVNYLVRKSFSVSEYGRLIKGEHNKNIYRATWGSYQHSYLYPSSLLQLAYTASFERYIPYEKFVNTATFIVNKILLFKKDPHSNLANGEDPYNDIIYARYLERSLLSSTTRKPTAHFEHLLFTHAPVRFDADCNYKPSSLKVKNHKSVMGKTMCGVKRFISFIKRLKSQHVFNNSLIFLVSDHGPHCPYNTFPGNYNIREGWCLARYMPLLMLKPFQSNHPYKESDFQASLIDISKTICKAVSNDKSDCSRYTGVNLLALQPKDKKNERVILVVNKHHSRYMTKYTDFHKISIGRSRNIVDFFISEPVVVCGKNIKFKDSYKIRGFSYLQSGIRWSNSKNAEIFFKGSSSICQSDQIKVKLSASLTKNHPEQRAKVMLNGAAIGDIKLCLGQKLPREVILNFSNKTYHAGKENVLQFRIDQPGTLGLISMVIG